MIEATWELIIVIIGIALVFDFTNGFHDSANSISTVVSTKVLSPRNAVFFAAFFNFIAAFGFGVAVASTVSKIIHLDVVQTAVVPYIILSALLGAILWNLITWFFGLPTSSSHALIGGLAGAGISAAGLAAIKMETIILVVTFMFVSPVIGLICGFLFMAAVLWLTRMANKQSAEIYFKRLQLCSAAAYSFSHGTNDAQKTMGIILPLLFSIGYFGASVDPNHLPVPMWVVLVSYTAIALGTLSGGWRIVKTMGYKITRLRPVHGFAAETAGATTILGASIAGIPVSTTHIICTSIMGVGTTMGSSTVKWGVARNIMWAWILTIPISAAIGYASFAVVRVIVGY
ncbi:MULTISPECIES: inorganic phosphate transporter [unclassified Methanoregula]|uniref:inorganic phosphate transporter n=1 Tax=unclassified Methanoregula TaxID=2649730 RepID=UPI0009D4941A|nr:MULTISPECIES: inorganic phosphate transporter [unclassified Methanoregula]OPX62963.1 MAG: Phosphate transporter family protein [Methanoregula sp. PtaB.Bin085]OPY35176.1 MAG: Phosphate transporter family protein [Methanoregula sp. PtaU1.Bin006]